MIINNLKKLVLVLVILSSCISFYAQTSEVSLSFYCAEILSMTVSETANQGNSATNPDETQLFLCESSAGFAEIDISLNTNGTLNENTLWQILTPLGVMVGSGGFNTNTISFSLPITQGFEYTVQVGNNLNQNQILDASEVIFEVDVFVLKVEITAEAEARSFNPSDMDDSGISQISISVNPPISVTNGHLNWTWEHKDDTTPNDLWDNHTGEVEFQAFTGSNWGNSLTFDTGTEINIRVKRAGRAILKVAYVVNNVECSDNKEISVPQFYDLNFDAITNNKTFNDDLELVGLKNSDIGTNSNQITETRNEIIRDEVISALKFGMEDCYLDVNVRFTESPPSFLTNDLKVICFVAGQHSPVPIDADKLPGIFNNDVNTDCYEGLPSSGNNLDIGNVVPTGKVCTYSGLLATGASFEPYFGNTFDFLPATNSMFDSNDEIIDNDLLIAIEKFGMLVGNVIAHEGGHALGLVPGTTHNTGNNGTVMDDGFFSDWFDRTNPYEFLIVNKNKIIQILPIDGQDGFQ